MFPVSDFNFVYCGMATFAATVGGYVYAKRRRIEPVIRSEPVRNLEAPTETQSSAVATDGNSTPDIEIHMETFDVSENNGEIDVPSASPTEGSIEVSDTATIPAASPSEPALDVSPSAITRGPSLKRKRMDDHDHDDNNNPLEYPYNLAALYPNKRCKTPPPTPPPSSDIKVELVEPKESTIENIVSVSEPIEVSTGVSEEIKPVQAEPKIVKDSRVPQPDDNAKEVTVLPESKKELPNTAIPSVVLPEPSPAQAPSTPKLGHKSGFESFATAPASLSPGNATLASGANMRPVWSTSNNFRKRHSFVDNPDEQSDSGGEGSTHALGLGSRPDVTPKVNRVTGEEEEDVESELKGVKLFIKRGSQDFSTGILGQVKYLWNKKTSSQRVLFRRDLGKISMNTRLQPTVRCTFDSQECILRLLLAEAALGPQEIVVYALKPGRFCSRKDFQSFAESVMGSASLK